MKPQKRRSTVMPGSLPKGTFFVKNKGQEYAIFLARNRGKNLPRKSRILKYNLFSDSFVDAKRPEERKILETLVKGALIPKSEIPGITPTILGPNGNMCAAQIVRKQDGSIDYKKSKAFLQYGKGMFSEVADPSKRKEIIELLQNY